MRMSRSGWLAVGLGILALSDSVGAHSGPPFPIVTTRGVGPYEVSVWADPDTTDDGGAGGQFWVTLKGAGGGSVPANTRARIAIRPVEGGSIVSATTKPENGEVSRQFVALLMDHEGKYHVRVDIDGGLGPALVEADVDATYDLRPPRPLLFLYLAPFVLAAFLWIKLLLRRRKRANG
jgi:hypothetical protein